MNRQSLTLVVVLLAAVFGAAGWFWQQSRNAEPPAAASPAPAAPPAAGPTAAAPQPPAIRHPIEAAPALDTPAEPPTIQTMLTRLFGQKAVASMFQLDDFPRRFVATVDNLARSHAPAQLWPIDPAEGRFTVQIVDGQEVISPDNGQRYTAHVLLLEAVDLRQAAATYSALYPQFQKAYEEIGFPNGYFNDRLVEVIDHLLATPEPAGLLRVRLPEIKGPVQPTRPWVMYQFDDPALHALSSGQRLLLRMGPVNQRRVKAKLAEFRALVAAP